MRIEPELFEEVPVNTDEESPCSPMEDDPEWEGILINAPKRVYFEPGKTVDEHGAFAIVPLCGYYLLPASKAPDEPMLIVAVNTDTQIKLVGPIIDLDPSPVDPPPFDMEPLSEEELEGMASGGHFNPNLCNFVRLPELTATYVVHVESGEFVSNEVTIELIAE